MKNIRKAMALILSMAIIWLSAASANAASFQQVKGLRYIKEQRLIEVFERKLESMAADSVKMDGECSKTENIYSIESISPLTDINGTLYTLIECSPKGYMIYHNDSGVFVEYSPATHSPYYGVEGVCYYAGPNEYYILDNDGQIFYAFDETPLTGDEISTLRAASRNVDGALMSNKDIAVLDYVACKTDVGPADIYITSPERAEICSAGNDDWTLINRYDVIRNMSDCGYIGGGKCGYIAAGILLTHKKVTVACDTVDYITHYAFKNGAYYIKPELPTALYNKGVSLGYAADTTSVAIHYTVEGWLADRGVTVDHTSLYAPIGNNWVVASHINNDRPVIWFGYIGENTHSSGSVGSHAVVVYGYDVNWGLYSYVAHFGWSGASEVYFTGILGSIYTFS